MELLAVIGGISAAGSIIAETSKWAFKLRRLYRDLRFAMEEVKLARTEASNCENLIIAFYDTTRSIQVEATQRDQYRKLDHGIRQQNEAVRKQIDNVLEKLEPLRENTDATKIQIFKAIFRWHITRSDASLLLKNLQCVKTSFILWSTLLALDQNNRILSNPNGTDSEERRYLLYKIKSLERQFSSIQEQFKELIRELSQQNANHRQEPYINLENLANISVSIQVMGHEPIAQARQALREMGSSSAFSSSRTFPSLYSGSLSRSSSLSRFGSNSLLSPYSSNRDVNHTTRPQPVTMPSEHRSLVLSRRVERSRNDLPEPHSIPPSHTTNGPVEQTTDTTISNRRSGTSGGPGFRVQSETGNEAGPAARSAAFGPVFRDYGDGNREEFMREHSQIDEEVLEDDSSAYVSDSSSGSDNQSGPGMYVPMPPFGGPRPQRLPRNKRKKPEEDVS